jgi:hypothetical protein
MLYMTNVYKHELCRIIDITGMEWDTRKKNASRKLETIQNEWLCVEKISNIHVYISDAFWLGLGYICCYTGIFYFWNCRVFLLLHCYESMHALTFY